MTDPELLRTMDYILNRCDEGALEAVAAAVVRRRRDLALFGGAASMPDPKRMAHEISAQVGFGGAIDGLKETIRDMAVKIIRREAPELSDEQANELMGSWIPSARGEGAENREAGAAKTIPSDLLEEMIRQFVAFSRGGMPRQEDQRLRGEMDNWPERYWSAFPSVVRLIIRDYLNNEISGEQFESAIRTALAL